MASLTNACFPVQISLPSTPTLEPTATFTAIPTNTPAPSPTPTKVVAIEIVQSITTGPGPLRLPTDLAFDAQGNFYR